MSATIILKPNNLEKSNKLSSLGIDRLELFFALVIEVNIIYTFNTYIFRASRYEHFYIIIELNCCLTNRHYLNVGINIIHIQVKQVYKKLFST